MVASCPPCTFLQAEMQFLKFMHVMVHVQQINYLVMIMLFWMTKWCFLGKTSDPLLQGLQN